MGLWSFLKSLRDRLREPVHVHEWEPWQHTTSCEEERVCLNCTERQKRVEHDLGPAENSRLVEEFEQASGGCIVRQIIYSDKRCKRDGCDYSLTSGEEVAVLGA